MEANRRQDDDLTSRVAATESDLKHVRDDVEKMSVEMHTGFQSIGRSISNLDDKLSVKSQTPWGLIISGGSLVITMITLIGVLGVGVPQKKTEAELHDQKNVLFDHITSTGHPAITERVLNQGDRIEVVNVELKREMRQLDAAIVQLLNTRVDGVVDTFEAKLSNIDKQVTVLNHIQLDKYKALSKGS